jgi:pyruvate-formate lyase-activating enzyme
MRIQTFSIVAGSEACNARCPFCISKMTVAHGVSLKEPEVNWRNFKKACLLAKQSGVTTAMLTGKGEPTLFPEQITKFLQAMQPFEFPFTELQSNGLAFMDKREEFSGHLSAWYELGLSTIAISIVHHLPEKNRGIYVPYRDDYMDLAALVDLLHGHGFSVRLTGVLLDNYIDGVEELKGLVQFCKDNQVEQLSVRPVNKPKTPRDDEMGLWIAENGLPSEKLSALATFLESEGTALMTLQHGAIVYDLFGQNICLTDSLTLKPGGENIRQLIFFPDGHLRYDWQHPGAILL